MDTRLVIEGLFAIAASLAAFYMRAMREDVKALVKTVANHGERLAVLESQVKDIRGRP